MIPRTDRASTHARAEMPAGTGHILDRRTLATGHRRLAALVTPGASVLDVGCGTAAITRDVAEAVGSRGLALGMDVSASLLADAAARPNRPVSLALVRADVYSIPFVGAFDIVSAARVLQWLARPADAVAQMAAAAKPRGTVLVLDYDHTRITWDPDPPASMQAFYAAFLAWRTQAGFDNAIVRRLPALLGSVGIVDVRVTPQPEQTGRGQPDFVARAGIWADVAATRGHQMVADGAVSASDRSTAERDYRAWVDTEARSMTLSLDAVEGRVV